MATRHGSNTQITKDPELIVAVVRVLLARGAMVLICPEPLTDAGYRELADGRPEVFDPVAIADWISIVPPP
jgi:hypothetical protein